MSSEKYFSLKHLQIVRKHFLNTEYSDIANFDLNIKKSQLMYKLLFLIIPDSEELIGDLQRTIG